MLKILRAWVRRARRAPQETTAAQTAGATISTGADRPTTTPKTARAPTDATGTANAWNRPAPVRNARARSASSKSPTVGR